MKQCENVEEMLIPCNYNVLLKLYDENPYNITIKTEKGLLIGGDGAKKYKSNETGEYEENSEYVACAKVIAKGPLCQNVEIGEDVFVNKTFLHPIPYKRMGYWMLAEQNISTRITKRKNKIINKIINKIKRTIWN